MIIIEYFNTCPAFPSQWEGTLDDGRMFYARYRYGRFLVTASWVPTEDVYEAVAGELIFQTDKGGDCDGSMDEAEFIGIMMENGFEFCKSIDINPLPVRLLN